MKIKDMQTLFVENLRDLYSAETQLIEALPKVAKAATSPELAEAVKSHLEETKEQKKRLERIFRSLEEDPEGHECAAMKGLIKEANEVIGDVKDPEVRDAALIGAAQKVEHYEIAGYGTARTYAQLLGQTEFADILTETLDEEGACNESLTVLAEDSVNGKALSDSELKTASNGQSGSRRTHATSGTQGKSGAMSGNAGAKSKTSKESK